MIILTPQTQLVALDLETTGLSAMHDRVVELAAVRWQDGRETATFEALVNPGRPIPPDATAVHGITDDMVAAQPPISQVLPAFLDFCRADGVLAHNASFDIRFLRAESARLSLALFATPVIDTCSLARQRLPGFPNYRLETLVQQLGLGATQSHRALQDARDCLAVFLCCVEAGLPAPPPAARATLPDAGLVLELRRVLENGGTLVIEYRGSNGRLTQRRIRPLQIDKHGLLLEAYCLLRNDTRHFYVNRISRIVIAD